MIKKLHSTLKTLLLIFVLTISKKSSAQLSFSLAPGNQTVCTLGNTYNMHGNYSLTCILGNTISGATYYTYTVSSGCSIFGIAANGLTTTVGVWCSNPGTHTITGLAYPNLSNSVIIASSTNTFFAIPGPSITVTGPTSVCPNSINVYTANGANTYTWNGFNGTNSYSLTGAIASMTAGTAANFSITSMAVNGCSNVTSFNPPTGASNVTISQATVCPGGTTALSANGANSYTWSNGSNSPIIVVSPTVSTNYTLISANNSCTMSSTHFVAVISTPSLNLNSPTNICSGNSATISSSGATSYTWTPGNLTGATIVVNPNVSTCYTVFGSNGGTCNSFAITCLSVSPSPSVSVISSGSVCSGSSISFTAMGANSYTWNTGSTGTSISTVPISSGNILVMGSHTLNSCTHTATIPMIVSPSCAIVWPGDANRDGSVSNLDVLELGLASGATGAARSATSNAWAGQFASTWNGTISTGWNKVHADCNGDGIVNTNDNSAITTNFGLTHSFKGSQISTNPDITIVPQQTIAYEGIWNKADIILGDATNSIAQLYGLAFDINYDQSKVETDSVGISYTASFLNANNTNIDFGKAIFTNGKLYCASVRTDHSNTNGNGKIAEFWYKVKTGLPINSNITISASNAQKVNTIGTFNTLNVDAGAIVSISNNVTGFSDENNNMSTKVLMYPNPSSKQITLQSTLGKTVIYSISDIIGRELLKGELNSSKQVDVSTLENGNYIVRFNSDKQSVTKKLIIN